MKFFGKFNLAARDNALRGIALHGLLLMLYARADEFTDGLGIYVKDACQQLFEENAESIALVRDNMEGMVAIQRSGNVTDWFVLKAEKEMGVHPTVSQLRAYILKTERGVREALQRDFHAGYLPHIDDRQWIEYWLTADTVFASNLNPVGNYVRNSGTSDAAPVSSSFRATNEEGDGDLPISREAAGQVVDRSDMPQINGCHEISCSDVVHGGMQKASQVLPAAHSVVCTISNRIQKLRNELEALGCIFDENFVMLPDSTVKHFVSSFDLEDIRDILREQLTDVSYR